MVLCRRQGSMVGVKGLDEYLSRAVSPSGPARHLGQELEGPLAGMILRKKRLRSAATTPTRVT